MRKLRKMMVLLSAILLIGMSNNVFAEEINNKELSTNEFLLNTGMSQDEIDKIDYDIQEYIVENLKENVSSNEKIEYLNTQPISINGGRSREVLSGISLYASAFKSAGKIHIYPTYEFTTAKRPRGKDSFSFQVGNAMQPYSYGGKVWYKINKGDSWQSDNDAMIANQQTLNGAEYSGSQLGTPDMAIYLKGCAYAHANVGTGTDKRICMNYVYNPNKYNCSISFSASGIGISISSSGTVYSAAQTLTLSY